MIAMIAVAIVAEVVVAMINLHVRFLSGSSRVYEVTENQIMSLEESRATGFIFIKLGNINYNVNAIESWWVSDDSTPKKREVTIEPVRPKSSPLRTGE
jgi:hypothetical protein